MSFIYITGSAGSGKTTIQNELLRLGYEAHDEDDPDIGSAHNKSSNKAVAVPPVDQRTPEWFSAHEWRVFPEALDKLKARSRDKLIFMCGNVATKQELKDVYDTVIFLSIDEPTLRKRVAYREGNDFGKTEYEVQMILERDKAARALHEQRGSVIVDASQPIETVVTEILEVSV